MAIVFSDDFTWTTINTWKWTETDPDSVISQSGTLILSNPHSWTKLRFTNKLQSVSTVTSTFASIQCNMTWTTDSTSESQWLFTLYKNNTNYCNISARTASGWVYRLDIVIWWTWVYAFETAITKGKDVKITYDYTTNEIKFWYWSGSAWTQMWTTQTFDLDWTLYALFTQEDTASYTGANPVTIDNFYMVDTANYSTQYPSSSTWNSNFFMFF